MTDDAMRGDLADLRKEFEGSGFTFGSVWASAGAGPDARRLLASRGTLADHVLERRRASDANPRGVAPQPVDRPGSSGCRRYLPR